ncbi:MULTISPECIES: MerR family transcriptional regulator [Priestia]|jgi:MerR family transcriptional regulator, repressor of the yfmOP operon|uniref:MerR family transcriptional regulator n=2 Tax=Priestia TaxID=2800373 RepID=A0A1X7DKY2_9BACI|nr:MULTISPECIES: MerR family transcriptional regulator [Priestia]AKO93327.1 MerR family transcriptional regulator [Priestia filamentosa]MCY8235528.1 MerR family transcriptional regulator [Priestia endophytica]MDT3763489.1 MerR family transcriptional regulator [Priestia filamentosa]MED4071044.1 MerR family transcriptional regulator [Priestia endophytica]OXS72013.1 MerR family transcriptional regulator [Priestia filamentosa]
MSEFKIDDVAKQSGLTKRTIRYYEQIGLLPSPPRSKGGIRLYSQEHIDFLEKITNAKEVMGFSLQELQQFIKLSDILELRKADYRQVKGTSEQKEKLRKVVNTVEEQLELLVQKKENLLKVEENLVSLRDRAKAALVRFEKEESEQ